jgi:hypothetical protein
VTAPTAHTPGNNHLPVSRGQRQLIAIVALGLALAVAGALISANLIRSGPPAQPPLPNGPFGLSQDIPTSYGALGVESVKKINGVTSKALAGSTHGIAHLIPPSKVRVEASVTFTNLLEKPVAYSPSQFRLVAGKGKPVLPFSSSIRNGTLQPSASIDAIVSFVVPRNGQKLQMAYYDRGRKGPVYVDLGRVGKRTPDSAFDRFHNH